VVAAALLLALLRLMVVFDEYEEEDELGVAAAPATDTEEEEKEELGVAVMMLSSRSLVSQSKPEVVVGAWKYAIDDICARVGEGESECVGGRATSTSVVSLSLVSLMLLVMVVHGGERVSNRMYTCVRRWRAACEMASEKRLHRTREGWRGARWLRSGGRSRRWRQWRQCTSQR